MALPRIPVSEFEERQRRFADELAARGLAGAVVWSNGGAAAAWHVDVFYLANHHAQVAQIPANPWLTGAGHSALVVPADGSATTLVTTTLDDPDGRSVAGDIVQAQHLPQEVASVLRERGLGRERVGLSSREALLAAHRDTLVEAAPDVELVACDDILERMRAVKSEAELALVRHAARAGVRWMAATLDAMRPGATEADVVAASLSQLIRDGGIQHDVAIASGPTSEHYWGSAGHPHWNAERPLRDGDLVHVDLWGPVNDYYTDFARTTVVGGEPTNDQLALIEHAIALVDELVAMVRPGVVLADVHARGMEYLREHGFLGGASFEEMFPGFGHSYGLTLENPSIVAGDPTVLEPNMVLGIETFLARPGVGGANFEHDLIVTADGVELLTADAPSRPWAEVSRSTER